MECCLDFAPFAVARFCVPLSFAEPSFPALAEGFDLIIGRRRVLSPQRSGEESYPLPQFYALHYFARGFR